MDNRDLNGNEVNEDLSAVDPSLTENEESTALIPTCFRMKRASRCLYIP